MRDDWRVAPYAVLILPRNAGQRRSIKVVRHGVADLPDSCQTLGVKGELHVIRRNRFGLSRWIPPDVRREVRQRSGFGCVLCGSAIIEYHHFDPPFVDATSHRADGITALCPRCHAKAESGRVSMTALCQALKNPHPLEVGYSLDELEIDRLPTVILGQSTFERVPIVLEVYGRTLLGVTHPELAGAPFGLNAFFFDEDGSPIAEIASNQWRAFVSNWDVETVGARTTIRRGSRDIALVFRTEPPSRLVIERIHMYYKGLRLVAEEGKDLCAYLPDGSLWFRLNRMTGCAKGIVLS